MKKLTAIIILVAALFSLASCGGEKYEPVPSTEREASVVMTMTLDGKSYDVKYELYRALFLSLSEEINPSGNWTDDKIEEINLEIAKRAADIFSVLATAEKIGINVYSKKYNEQVADCVTAGVVGGTVGGYTYEGFGGDYDKYLASLREMYLNYSVQDLMLRYALALDDIYYHYKGNIDEGTLGKLEHTRDDVWDFYHEAETVRVMQLFLSTASTSYTLERAEEIRDEIAACENEKDVFNKMMKYSLIGDAAEDLADGRVIAPHSLDRFYYGELLSEAGSIGIFETSSVVEVSTSSEHGYFILYRIEKTDEHFDECFSYIEDVYLENEIGKILDAGVDGLVGSIKTSSVFDSLDYSKISMDE